MPLLSWTERYEPNTPDGSWKDCSYCAYLEALVYGGWRRFPLGIFTVAQREAFEDASGLPESQQEHGTFGFGVCDHASQTLFGVTLHKADRSHLLNLLSTPGLAIALQGVGEGLPSRYTGQHAVCAVSVGGGNALMYDPLSPNMSLGVPCKIEPLVAWNARLRYAEIRWIKQYELVEAKMSPLSGYRSVSPAQRVLDTRSGFGLAGKFVSGVPRELNLNGVPGVPEGCVAVVGNLTVTRQTAPGFLAVSSTPEPPVTSTLNFPMRDNRANGGIFPLTNGSLWITYTGAGGECDVILDVNGAFEPLP